VAGDGVRSDTWRAVTGLFRGEYRMRQVALFGCFEELQLAAATGRCGRRIILAMNYDTSGGERNSGVGWESWGSRGV
jgi:hypothetical protein